MRNRIYAEQGVRIRAEGSDQAPARINPQHALICGSPATVAEEFAEIGKIGIGGVIMAFRLGPMPHETAMKSLELFMTKVAPEFERK
jgi:alkanesulfonate monooxygenase SsuD/methylene tetrahydromethanopterin reductase-like flavin-dependent oxidoreductase (luciferase family)